MFGFLGSIVGQFVTSSIDKVKFSFESALQPAMATGLINIFSSIGAGIGEAIRMIPAISTTTTTLANSLNAMCTVATEIAYDFWGNISSILP